MAIMLNPVRTVAPATRVVTAAEVRAQIGSPSSDDTVLEALIDAATEALELELGRAFITQTWRVDYDEFDDDYMILPLRPVQSITSITYYDADNASQTAANTLYGLYASTLGTHVALLSDQEWPGTFERSDAVMITFVAGYGAASDVPAPLKQAVILAVKEIYHGVTRDTALRREDIDGVGSREWAISEATQTYSRTAMKALVEPYRVMAA